MILLIPSCQKDLIYKNALAPIVPNARIYPCEKDKNFNDLMNSSLSSLSRVTDESNSDQSGNQL